MSSKRLLAIAVSTLALTGTSVGIVLAATGGNSSGLVNLNGYPPHNMRLDLSIGTGGDTRITGSGIVDVTNSAFDITLSLPLLVTTESLELRAVGGKLYYTTSNLSQSSSAQWYVSSLTVPDLTPLALEFLHPDTALIKGATKGWVTTNAGETINHYRFVLPKGSTGVTSVAGGQSVTVSIATGTARELASASVAASLNHQPLIADLTVLGYNDAPRIVAPRTADTKAISGQSLQQMLAQLAPGSLGQLLSGLTGGSSTTTTTPTFKPA
jgi:hypothetical protein